MGYYSNYHFRGGGVKIKKLKFKVLINKDNNNRYYGDIYLVISF